MYVVTYKQTCKQKFFIRITLITQTFSHFLLYFFAIDNVRMQPMARTSLAVAFWKKRTKKIFFDYYSFFQPRIKCISTSLNAIPGLYFDGTDNVDDEEHWRF